MVVRISFLKRDVLSQFEDCYSKVLLSLLMTSSFKVNQLYSLPSRFTEQKARPGGELSVFFYYEPTGNHQPLTDTSQVLLSGKLKKFTAQLYNLFLSSLPQLERRSRKYISLIGNFRKWPLWGKTVKKVSIENIKMEKKTSAVVGASISGSVNEILTAHMYPGSCLPDERHCEATAFTGNATHLLLANIRDLTFTCMRQQVL